VDSYGRWCIPSLQLSLLCFTKYNY
jgi:hypothetical protein